MKIIIRRNLHQKPFIKKELIPKNVYIIGPVDECGDGYEELNDFGEFNFLAISFADDILEISINEK